MRGAAFAALGEHTDEISPGDLEYYRQGVAEIQSIGGITPRTNHAPKRRKNGFRARGW